MKSSILLSACLLVSSTALATSIATPGLDSVSNPSAPQAPTKPVVKKVTLKKAPRKLAQSSQAERTANQDEKTGPADVTPPVESPDASTAGPNLSNMSKALKNYFTDDETKLLYQFMKDSVVASLKGDEAESLPPDLAFKMEILMARMKREGGAYMDNLSQQIEADLRKRRQPPPPAEYVPSHPWAPENNPWLSR